MQPVSVSAFWPVSLSPLVWTPDLVGIFELSLEWAGVGEDQWWGLEAEARSQLVMSESREHDLSLMGIPFKLLETAFYSTNINLGLD